MLLQVGVGLYAPSNPSELEYLMSAIEQCPGVHRTELGLSLALGAAITKQNYILVRMDAGADRVSDSSAYIQVNYYLASLGTRYYLKRTGLYIEGDAGMAFDRARPGP